jgi:hypothetical protein
MPLFLLLAKKKKKRQRQRCWRCFLCCATMKQKEEGDGNNVTVTFFVMLQQKKGNSNIATVTFFAALQKKKAMVALLPSPSLLGCNKKRRKRQRQCCYCSLLCYATTK